MVETFETTWQHVRTGARVIIRGVPWEVVSHDPMVLRHPSHGERVGTPKPGGPVTVALPMERPGTTMAEAVALVARDLGGEVIARKD